MNMRTYWLVVAVMAWGTQVVAESEKNTEVVTLNDLVGKGDTSLKIRFVEQIDAMKRCEPGIECGEKLKHTHEKLTQALVADEQKFTQAYTEFQGKASAMNESARKDEEKKLRRMSEDLERKKVESGEEFNAASEKETVGLLKDTDKAIARVAQRDNIDAVVDTTGRVVYRRDTLDITEDVIKELNKEHQVKVANAKKAKADVIVASNAKTSVATQNTSVSAVKDGANAVKVTA